MYKPGNRDLDKVRYHAKGLCTSCYSSIRLGTSPKIKIYFDNLGQTCSRCNIYQCYTSYLRHTKNLSGYASWCKICQKMYKFGLTKVDYDSMVEAQNGLCAICDKVPSGVRPLVVDHDHKCCAGVSSCGECIRGLLCDNCNKGIGLLRDDTEIILSAYNYLNERGQ